MGVQIDSQVVAVDSKMREKGINALIDDPSNFLLSVIDCPKGIGPSLGRVELVQVKRFHDKEYDLIGEKIYKT